MEAILTKLYNMYIRLFTKLSMLNKRSKIIIMS